MKKFDLIIIGGGASGMMAAYAALKSHPEKNILIIEKNEKLGKKIYITGKGRCNVTNNCDIDEFLDNVTTNPYFMYSSIYSFTIEDTINFFTSNGVKLKTERANRVFPQSDKSSDIIKALSSAIQSCQINLNEEVFNISSYNNYFNIETSKGKYETNKLIIATGGKSYPGTGSTGDGYKFAKKFGHNIKTIKPSLCPILLDDDNVNLVTGLTVKNAEITVYIKNKKVNSYFGDFLFTHRGISGPIVLTLSDFINDFKPEEVNLFVNFKPSIPIQELEERLLKDISSNQNKELKTIINNYFPNSLAEYLMMSSDIDYRKKCNSITKEERKKLIKLFTEYKFNFKEIDNIRQAIITKGGIDVDEINPSSMESKLISGLYFCGEVIDVNALTGGFNLQIAFSTGYLAGKSIFE